jgi:hypothetical protein
VVRPSVDGALWDERFVHSRPRRPIARSLRPTLGELGSADTEARSQWQVSDGGGIFAVWSADGRELCYLNPAGAMVAVPIDVRGDR